MGIDVEVVCAPPSIINPHGSVPRYMEYHDIRIRRVWATSFPKLNFVGRIVNQLTYAMSVFYYFLFYRERRPILVLTNPPFLAFFCALLKKIKIGNPYIYVIFDVYPDTAINVGVLNKYGLLCRLWERVNKISFEHASNIIVIGRCMKNIIESKMSKYGIKSNNKVQMIHVWSDDRRIQVNKSEKKQFFQEWGLEGKFVVLYSGNMGRFHDMETIMSAVKELSDFEDIAFLFVGEGHKKSWMMAYAQKNNLLNCKFHSYVKREDLGDLLASAEIGLVSLMNGQEGLSVPSKAFGLMAAGLPVIGIMSSSSEIATIISDENCGIVIKPGDFEGLRDEILSLYNDRQRLREMGKNSRRAIDEKYNLKTAAIAYFELIINCNKQIHGG